MFNIKELVSKITDKGIRPKAGDSSSGVLDHGEHLSAEGFLCPPCMKAFPSPEALEEHYIKAHPLDQATEAGVEDVDDIIHQDDGISEALMQEVLQLQLSDMSPFGAGFDGDDSARKALEESNTALKQEVKSLRSQLRDEGEQLSQLRDDQELLKEKFLQLAGQNDELAAANKSLSDQLGQRTNEYTNADAIRQELEELRRTKDDVVNEKQKEINELLAQVEKLRVEINDTKDQVLSENESVKSQLQEELRKLQEENLQLQHELDTSLEKIHRKEEEYLSVKIKLEEANERIIRTQQSSEEVVSRSEAEKSNIAKFVEESENLRRELENLRSENKKVVQGLENKLQNAEKVLKDVKDKNELEQKKASERISAITASLEQKGNEIALLQSQAKSDIEAKDSEIEKLRMEITKMTKEKAEMEKSLQDFKIEQSKLRESLTVAQNANTELQASLSKLKKELDSLKSKWEVTARNSAEKDDSISSLETQLNTLKSTTSKKIADMENLIQDKDKKIATLSEEKSSMEQTNAAKLKAKDDDISSLEELLAAKSKEVGHLTDAAKNSHELAAQHASKVAVLEDRIQEMDAMTSELKLKLKSSEEEKALLADRCLVEQSKAENFQQAHEDCKRKLDDTVAALHELGRENQSLQMESAKLQGRKWADDSLVNSCTSCAKEFTLTIRKHHCRQCGQIFCNDCSSRSASVPSSKKPVRVCDACYQELDTK